MAKKKCPACGSLNTVKIIYGLPTPETIEAVYRGECVIGGCCVSDIDPKRHCKSCGQEFGGGRLYPLFEMTSFEFYVGGYFGPSHHLYIDGKRKNKLIRYAKTQGGMYVDLKHPKNPINFHPEVLLKEIPLPSEKWLSFIKDLSTLEIPCWNDEYNNVAILDGTQWELIIRLPNRITFRKNGSNSYPPYWNKFTKILKKYVGEDIG